jgi:hypothetical protein
MESLAAEAQRWALWDARERFIFGVDTMPARRLVVRSLLTTLLSVAVVADPRCFSGLAQRRYTGALSSEQRRAVEIYISSNAASSGFFSTGQVSEKLRFKAGEHVNIGIVITNTGIEALKICAFSNPYYQNRPDLLRDGKPQSYSERVSESVRESNRGTCVFTRTPDVVDLNPNIPLRVPSIQLQEWYGPLEPGQYKLILKRTFACCADGAFNPSNEISFEVTR